jgi:nitrogen fixation protein FixH
MTARPSDKFIPWYIVAFFVSQMALFAWFFQLAHDSYPGVVTEKAYEKGLKYNDTIAQAERQEQLGWTSVVTMQYLDGKAHVELLLKDAGGQPISGATASAWFVRPARGGMDGRIVMKHSAGGIYVAELALPARGLWEVRVAAERRGQTYQTSRKVVF